MNKANKNFRNIGLILLALGVVLVAIGGTISQESPGEWGIIIFGLTIGGVLSFLGLVFIVVYLIQKIKYRNN